MFKVICKTSNNWERTPIVPKLVNTSKFFGLIKSSKIVMEPDKVPGSTMNEICIVTDTYVSNSEDYYKLTGYPYGGYNSKYFIRLDEFTETQKEIAQKSQPILN